MTPIGRLRLARCVVDDGSPVRRYGHSVPGDLVHVDVKKLGNIPDGGGWARGRPDSRQAPPTRP